VAGRLPQQGETRRLACFRGQNRNLGHIKAQVDFRGELGTVVLASDKRKGGRAAPSDLAAIRACGLVAYLGTLDVLPAMASAYS
jgi:hypothetical protein